MEFQMFDKVTTIDNQTFILTATSYKEQGCMSIGEAIEMFHDGKLKSHYSRKFDRTFGIATID